MPRKNSFARALADAEKRLEKALAEKIKAHEILNRLHDEIPRLQMTIAALRDQVEPVRLTGAGHAADHIFSSNQVPPELASLVGSQDLSGMGSIPHPTEDELLPEPEGEPLTEKD